MKTHYWQEHSQSKLQSSKAMNNYNAMAGLLTCSPFCLVFPSAGGQWH